jgi:von Willebrand factor type A domain
MRPRISDRNDTQVARRLHTPAAMIGLALLALLSGAPLAYAAGSVALILDASGSMNARLPEGIARIEAAKSAVAELVGKLPDDTRLALWAYGHQSPTPKHDCRDTERVVGFDAVSANKDAVLAKTRAIRAQGYTPITYVIKLAADDLGKEDAKPRTLILVSDGKETCEGDPCAAAKALADADASLVVHTIGFAVDMAAKYQLQCIARVARGRYFDAGSTAELASTLSEAAKPAPPPQEIKQVVIATPQPGRLEIRHVTVAASHKVSSAETGEVVASLSSSGPRKELPAGLYNVTFGSAVWKSVEVRPGETTVLDPGVIEVHNADLSGHKVLDAETGADIGKISSSSPRITVLPSTFSVQFGATLWKDIEVKSGEVKVLNPGVIEIAGLNAKTASARVVYQDGTPAGRMNSSWPRLALPPGKYVVEVAGQRTPVELAEGTKFELKLDPNTR